MINSLRRKFIIITMASVAAVLLVIVGTANVINYLNVSDLLEMKLEILADNKGEMNHEIKMNPNNHGMDEANNAKDVNRIMENQNLDIERIGERFSDGDNSDNIFIEDKASNKDVSNEAISNDTNKLLDKDMIVKRDGFFVNGVTEEFPYETRFFTVTLSQSGNVISVNCDKIAAVSEEDAKNYAIKAYGDNKEDGSYNDYIYRKVELDDGSIMYIFLDSFKEMSSFRNFLMVSVLVSVVGMVLVFVLVWGLSKIVMKPVVESYEKQKRFITDASHELKTPVAIINANVEVLEMESGKNDWIRSITKQTNRLANLIEKMIFLSRMDENKNDVSFENVDFTRICKDVAESFTAIAQRMQKKYSFDIDEKVVVKGDENTLTEMVSILIDNAFKYSDEKGNVKVFLSSHSKCNILEVTNSVSEIEVGNHNELFERFYRRDKSRNSKKGGFGIGLSVAEAIVANHKGKISAFSKDGKSITFKVILKS